MEVLDLYDQNRVRTGKTVNRGQAFKNGEYILIVHVCIIDNHRNLLIQKRHHVKELWPGKWDIGVGGSVVSGEDSGAAAEREVFEELGISIDLSDERPYFTVNFGRGFADYYIVEAPDFNADELKLQSDEVAEVRWADRNEIFNMIESGLFIPYKKSIIEMIFDMSGSRGETRSV